MNLRTHPLAAASCLFLLTQIAPADTIVMKSGARIEGKVLRETAESYIIEVKVGTIRDEKAVPRADVSFIEKEKPDEVAFKGLEGLVPAPELLDKEGYESRIKKLGEFLQAYPESDKAKEVKAMVEELSAELAVVSAGGIKFGEGLVSAEDYEFNAYEIDSRIAEKQIKDSVARRDLLGALRMFSEYGTKFGESEGRPGMTALMLQVLAAYKQSLDESLASLDARMEARKAGLVNMSAEDRAKTEAALREQMESVEKRFADEKAAGQKWLTPDAFHKESIDEALRMVATETASLERGTEGTPLEMPLAEVYRSAWVRIATGTEEEKKKVFEEAKTRRLPAFYLEKLRIRAGLAEN